MSEIRSKISGEFTEYDQDAVFRLDNGQVWQQRRYKYAYKYKYRPDVRIYNQGGGYMMEVDCMDEPIEVVHASILAEGQVTSDFKGFNRDMVFAFSDGSRWKQAEYKYEYHYAYRPDAIVIDGVSGVVLSVDGMSDTVQVKRAS